MRLPRKDGFGMVPLQRTGISLHLFCIRERARAIVFSSSSIIVKAGKLDNRQRSNSTSFDIAAN